MALSSCYIGISALVQDSFSSTGHQCRLSAQMDTVSVRIVQLVTFGDWLTLEGVLRPQVSLSPEEVRQFSMANIALHFDENVLVSIQLPDL